MSYVSKRQWGQMVCNKLGANVAELILATLLYALNLVDAITDRLERPTHELPPRVVPIKPTCAH